MEPLHVFAGHWAPIIAALAFAYLLIKLGEMADAIGSHFTALVDLIEAKTEQVQAQTEHEYPDRGDA